MEKVFIHPSALVIRSTYQEVIKLYRNVRITDCNLGNMVSVGDDTTIERSVLQNCVQVNRRSYINDSEIGKYSYTGINTIINFAKIGSFCSIGRNVDIGGKNHDYRKITTMESNRFFQMLNGGGKLNMVNTSEDHCKIGNDVWIAAGTQIMRHVTIADGAVVGAGAVVTHDIPPYAIAVGVPAKVIGYRCSEQQIKRLLDIKWWDWSEDKIKRNMQLFLSQDISDEILDRIEDIHKLQ